ncbi:MAG: hypothetical protein WBW12_17405 [Terriglobales bacterium]
MALMGLSASAQANPSGTNDNNLYSLALKASILQMEKEWGHLGHSAFEDKIEVPTDYRHMLVLKDPIITDDLPTAFENHSMEFVDDQELVDRYRKLRKSFAVLKIGPIRNQGSVLKIVVSTSWFSYKKHRRQFDYSDWSDVEFHYDCGQGAFSISSVKLGGI